MADAGGRDSEGFGGFAEDLLRDAPCGIAVSDPEGRTLYLNSTLISWLGGEDSPASDTVEGMFTPPGRIYFQTHVLPMIQLQGFVREIALHMRRPGRPDLSVLLNGVLRKDREGRAQRIDWMLFDATERSLYEAQLRGARREAEELAAIVRASPNPILRVDGDGRVESWNTSAERLTGIDAQAARGRPVDEALSLAGEDEAGWFARYLAHFDAGETVETRDVSHVSGREFEITITPIATPDTVQGRPDFSVVLRDITVRKLAEAHLGLVIDELNHRVKNTLGVVMGIARQTLDGDEARNFGERLQALTRAHNLLTDARWDSIELEQLFEITQGQAGGAERLDYATEPVSLSPRHATSMSMALHELVTNAIKYGALSHPGGRVRLSCTATGQAGDRRLRMEWRETGGPEVAPPEATGFGSKMISRIFASEFDADVHFDFRPEGLCCVIECPVPPPE